VNAATVLHVGCGRVPLPDAFDGMTETRLDVDPACEPDIVASMSDLGDIGPFHIVYSSHALEHLSPKEGAMALSEFRRVLHEGGMALAVVPNLDGIKPTTEVVYESPCGPITGRDMFYGHADLVETMPFMAHRTGFVPETLAAAFEGAGFRDVKAAADDNLNLICFGFK
jgi:hypothetical protein